MFQTKSEGFLSVNEDRVCALATGTNISFPYVKLASFYQVYYWVALENDLKNNPSRKAEDISV